MSHQAELLILHGQLIAGDLRVAHRIVEIAILPLKSIVGLELRMTDPQDVEQACFDALFEYLQAPQAYSPARAQLITYLAAIAKGRAKTSRRSNLRRLARDDKYLRDQQFDGPALHDLELGELDAAHRAELVKDVGDGELLNLIARGVNDLGEVAKSLNLTDDERGHEQAKKRLERMRGRLRRLNDKIGAE